MSDIGIYLPTLNRPTSGEEERALRFVAEGLQSSGLSFDFVTQPRPFPVAVMFGWGKLQHQEILRMQRVLGAPTLVVNFGSLKREEGYYTLGWNGLNGRANYCNLGSPRDRWMNLGMELKPWRQNGEHVVITGQVPTDGAVSSVDIVSWCEQQAIILKKLTNRPLVFRPHPLARSETRDILNAQRSERSLEEDLKNAWAVVTYNSTSSGMSVIEGVPVFTADQGSMAWEVANHDLQDIEIPILFDRAQWSYNIAYTQWNLDEIQSGQAWNHLKKGSGL